MLSLITACSTGSTLEQFLSFLGSKSVKELISLNSQIVSSVLLTRTIESSNNTLPRDLIVSFGNGVRIDHRFRLKPSFEEVARSVYGAKAKSVDLAHKGNQAEEEINLWIEEATRGLIKELLPKDSIGPDPALVLASSLFFKGSWDKSFNASKPKIKGFRLLNGESVQVPSMTKKSYGKHLYGSFDGFKVLKMPYQTGDDARRFGMYFFLPNSKDGLKNLVQRFNSNPEMYDTKHYELREEDS